MKKSFSCENPKSMKFHIKVYVWVRPLNKREIGQKKIIEIINEKILQLVPISQLVPKKY